MTDTINFEIGMRNGTYFIETKHPDWECFKNNKRKLGGRHMSKPEPLIAQYKLEGWLNPESKRGDPLTYQCSLPAAKLNMQYRGLFYKGDRDADAADTNNTN